MVNRIHAGPRHNLFSYTVNGEVIPVTYTDLTEQMRTWLLKIGIRKPDEFSSHSLRWGGASHAFKKGVPELTIQLLGNWASEAYKRYISITLESRLKAWLLFNNF